MKPMKLITILAAAILLCGCGSSSSGPASKALNADGVLRQRNYMQNMEMIFEAQVAEWRAGQYAAIDTATAAAVASVTKPDGTANAQTLQALTTQNIKLKLSVDAAIVAARSKFIVASADGNNVLSALGAQANATGPSNAELVNQITTGAIGLIEQYMSKGATPAPVIPIPKPVTVPVIPTTTPTK